MSQEPSEIEAYKLREKIYDDLAKSIGRASMVWNDVQSEVFFLFKKLSKMDLSSAEAVFFAVKTDASQREMTAALAKIELKDDPNNLDRVLNNLKEAGNLAAQRNVAIHTAWLVGEDYMPRLYGRLTRPKALRDDAENQFKELHDVLVSLFLKFSSLRKEMFPDGI